MNESKHSGRFARFFEEKGFYIILFLCVAAIGIAGYVLFIAPSQSDTSADIDQAVDLGTAPQITTPAPVTRIPATLTDDDETPSEPDEPSGSLNDAPEEDIAPVVNTDAPQEDADAVETGKKQDEPKAEQKPTETPKSDAAPTFFVKPVSGEIIREFCVSELVYDRTMGDWRTHNGADFGAAAGEVVAAIADGTVREVYRNEFYGTCVVIAHAGGMESVYYGLAEEATVKAGDAVKAGDTIGSLGSGCHFEALEPAHLHLEVKRDGTFIDPKELIK